MKNKVFKKTMALALAGAMTLSMAACGNDDAGDSSQESSQQSEQQESPVESTDGSSEESSGEESSEESGQAEAPQIEDTSLKLKGSG